MVKVMPRRGETGVWLTTLWKRIQHGVETSGI